MLMSKHKPISRKEFENRFLVERKEWNIVASRPKPYDKCYIDTYDQYIKSVDLSSTEMFWIIPSDVTVDDDFKFDIYFSHNNVFDRKMNHVFLNGEHYDGIMLMSKHKPISRKEFENRFLVERKEWNIVASNPKPYDKCYIDTYDQYLEAKKTARSEMFWIIPKEVEVLDFNFNLYFSHHNQIERRMNHVFQHKFRNELTYNGIMLTSKNLELTKKEIDFRYPVDKKEYAILASCVKPYDIVFISYNEPNADENYKALLEKFPRAKRVHGVKGIHQAHIEAAKQVSTDMFWVVDGDAQIDETFQFNYEVSRYEIETVHVWSSRNPINNLVYGYGGIKLLPTKLSLNMDVASTDMTTSISSKFKVVTEVSNVTMFNTDSFNTWKSAFRECAKLASQSILRQDDKETQSRLRIWKTAGIDKPYGKFAIQGAIAGEAYGLQFRNNNELLRRINDFKWLKNKFNKETCNEKT
jgi:CYTH domain-containing protein